MRYVIAIPFEGPVWNTELSQMMLLKQLEINNFNHLGISEGKHRWEVFCDPLVMMIAGFQLDAQVIEESERSK